MHNKNWEFLLEGTLRALSVFILLEYMTSSLQVRLPWLEVPIILLCILGPTSYSSYSILRRDDHFCSAYLLSAFAYVLMVFVQLIAKVLLPEYIMLFPRREMVNAEGLVVIGIFSTYTLLTMIVRISLFGIAIYWARRDRMGNKK